MSKIQVSFEEIESLYSRLAEINAVPFADIEWIRGGHAVTVSPEVAGNWHFIGLSNTAFVEFDFNDPITTEIKC